MTEFTLGNVFGVRLSARPSALTGSLALWAVLSGMGMSLLRLSLGVAVLAGLTAVALHWFAGLWHHLGHAWAARRTGYPMTGIRFGTFGVLATSLYPQDEPTLPAAVHTGAVAGGRGLALAGGVLLSG